ncbi:MULTISPECIES: ATP-binding cassette domain-containing protein [unclassified Brevibacterium]|uniref:ATP-binding cassette domain-containing protein n=1 Tax=unclassified Brevibacterium TaxID=2614124 RepID=UPI0010F95328|nr:MULTISPECIES: ATP-binding cassette domain-containing protein [unclassified Brevibacterium]MCM1011193.1 ATP-binding cassette domain-containing protein [Brevibacterium sp. XM4083]
MSEQTIRIRDAVTNNLDHLDLDIRRGRLVVIAGVSGSGKSSLVFDTIAAEAGAELNETFPPFTRNRLPKWTRPAVGGIDGLSPVIVIDQRRLGGNARSTVGTITDTWTYLRLLFSRLSVPHVGESSAFSFNDPAGMCPTCSGIGEVVVPDVGSFLDCDRSLADGAIALPGFGEGQHWYRKYAEIGAFAVDRPLRDWPQEHIDALLYGGDHIASVIAAVPKDYEGVVERFERIYLRTSDTLSERKRKTIAEFTHSALCPDCGGERLHEAARTATVDGHTIAELARLEIPELRDIVRGMDRPEVSSVVTALCDRLAAMETIGLGYLHLARATGSLSGGESQRIKAVRHLGSSLIEMLYVFDEPTVGLHPHDVTAMVDLLGQLRDRGNTVLVVEHDPAVMAQADEVIEIGPGPGSAGGRLVFQGTFDGLLDSDGPTGRALATGREEQRHPRSPDGWVRIANATTNNLGDITVDIPRGVLTVLTGVAGSGKSSLASELVAQHEAITIDQKPVSANRRSTPITYTGIAAAIRRRFAKLTGAPEGLFSANSEGGCPVCRGLGIIYTDLAFMDGQETTCPTCRGTRFTAEALAHTADGLTIADVEHLTVTEALARLDEPTIRARLVHLDRVGLGYLRLGQPLNTLSGGEAQRVKIAKELRDATEPSIYLLDEPTTGLHISDIARLSAVLDDLLGDGHTVVVIEHNLDVIRTADWLIDLGPGPGRHGGQVLYSGPTAGIGDTATGRALREG